MLLISYAASRRFITPQIDFNSFILKQGFFPKMCLLGNVVAMQGTVSLNYHEEKWNPVSPQVSNFTEKYRVGLQ